MAVVGACCEGACHEGTCHKGACHKGAYGKEGGISGKVGIGGRVGISNRAGIGASSSKDAFRPLGVPLLLHRASSIVYSGGVGK